ncbi:hypothetical protein A6P39_038645 [Streptomyces sp. FXJ1.172]|uniref:hypothetical protein n=1 Tax=Streptomyces sp. FXJ1.172 TaxID=710705 RepID=UPI0007CF0E43
MGIGAQRGVVAVLGLGVAVALAGCGSGSGGGTGGDGWGEGAGAPSSTADSSRGSSASPAASRPASAPTGTGGGEGSSDVGACYDGRCRLVVTKEPTRIPVDSRFGVGSLEVTGVRARSVVVQASGNGAFLTTSVGEGGTGSMNGLSFRVAEVRGGTAVLDFFPSK